jgi:hypothetical protein
MKKIFKYLFLVLWQVALLNAESNAPNLSNCGESYVNKVNVDSLNLIKTKDMYLSYSKFTSSGPIYKLIYNTKDSCITIGRSIKKENLYLINKLIKSENYGLSINVIWLIDELFSLFNNSSFKLLKDSPGNEYRLVWLEKRKNSHIVLFSNFSDDYSSSLTNIIEGNKYALNCLTVSKDGYIGFALAADCIEIMDKNNKSMKDAYLKSKGK